MQSVSNRKYRKEEKAIDERISYWEKFDIEEVEEEDEWVEEEEEKKKRKCSSGTAYLKFWIH